MQTAARLALPPTPTPAPAPAVVRQRPLWVAIDFPLLALEALSIGAEDYAVVVESSRHGAIAYRASAPARSRGIMPGLGVNAAIAVCTGLSVYSRDINAEHQQLRKLHDWANRFTPTVCVEHPTTLLLEVAASLKLFGGLDNLCEQLRYDLEQSGHHYYLAVAPTPAASSILASAAQQVLIMDQADLRGRLGRLPIQSLKLSPDTNRKLQALGVVCLYELWRLPRYDLARRFGPEVIRRIDRLLGAQPDPRRADSIPLEFDRYRELEVETSEAEVILAAARSLLVQLNNFLQRVDAVVEEIQVILCHAEKTATHFKVGTRLPTRDFEQWWKLLYAHIQAYQLDAPVVCVRLSSRHLLSNDAIVKDLFSVGDPAQEWARSLDELEARLGTKCLWVPKLAADHRPEYAWHQTDQRPGVSSTASVKRPLWLFPKPQKLRCKKDQIWHNGLLRIINGPERIESGWWDNGEYCRDYYTATSPQDGQLWVFQDLKQKNQWYLHGLFG